MLKSSTTARIVLTTAANSEEASRVGRTLVEEKLVACATLIPAIESIYGWKGNIESSVESMLLLKTNAARLRALEARLHELHSYETPEFLVLPVEGGSHSYLEWMNHCLSPGPEQGETGKTGKSE